MLKLEAKDALSGESFAKLARKLDDDDDVRKEGKKFNAELLLSQRIRRIREAPTREDKLSRVGTPKFNLTILNCVWRAERRADKQASKQAACLAVA